MNDPVTTPLTWRQLGLVVLLAGLGSAVLFELTLRLIILPLQVYTQPAIGLIGLMVLYLANLPFGFSVGYLWPRRHLGSHMFLGIAGGLAQWLGITARFGAYGIGASSNWFLFYAIVPALIFSSVAVIGDLVRKGQLTLNIALLTGAIGLIAAIVGLVSNIIG